MTTKEVAQLFGVTEPAVHYWIRLGLLRPKQQKRYGKRDFDEEEVKRLKETYKRYYPPSGKKSIEFLKAEVVRAEIRARLQSLGWIKEEQSGVRDE